MEPRKRHKKGKIAPEDKEYLTGFDNSNFQMDEMGDKSLNNQKDKSHQNVKDGEKQRNVLALISNVKQNASKWLAYTTSRRQKRRHVSQDDEDVVDGSSREASGLGLDDVHDDYISLPTVRRSIKSNLKTESNEIELAAASNRALIQYFAKLGHSKGVDEVVNLEFVQNLFASGADINSTDKYGQTILHEVARAWHMDVAKFLIENGADLNKGDSFGRTPLHVAAAVDYPEMVILLIENGADKEARTLGEDQTPVFFAAKTDATASLRALINQGCLFKKVKDFKGRTPIHVAAELDRSETARLLLEMQAPVWIPDNSGYRAITWMINKMAPVANDALNQFHLTDRPNRKQQFYLNFLVRDKETDPDGRAGTPLHVAVQYKLTDLLMHTVLIRYLDIQWSQFGRFWALISLLTNFLYIVLWTAVGMAVEYNERHIYKMPKDIWRIVLYMLAAVFTVYQMAEEILEYRRSQRLQDIYEKRRKDELEKDLAFTHPRWPMERTYLEQEMLEVSKLKPKYFRDSWNIFDWLCYTLLMVCIITHIADIAAHSETLARSHIRIMAITIIFLWLRLMKNARAFALLGPFIVMLGHMLKDFVKFMFLYLEFYIPYLAAFWMIFGGTKKSEENSEERVNVTGFEYFGQLFFSLFRLTLVDEYDYDGMKKIDSIMADILLASWFIFSAILCLNLFIALLSETFTRVYDKAEANAIMQKAITILNIWEGLSRNRKDRFHDFIMKNCSPLTEDYDDDLTQSDDDNIKKVTIEIKEEIDNLQDMFKRQFGDPDSPSWYLDNPQKSNSKKSSSITVERFESEVDELKNVVNSMKIQQDAMTNRLRRDMTSIKSMLTHLVKKDGLDVVDSASLMSEQMQSEFTPVSRMKKKKKKKRSGPDPNEDGRTSPSPKPLETTSELDITTSEFSPVIFPNLTRAVQPQAFDIVLSTSPGRGLSQGGEDDGNSAEC